MRLGPRVFLGVARRPDTLNQQTDLRQLPCRDGADDFLQHPWTIIFGLAFAFFMTLLILPAMYLIAERLRRPMRKMYGGKWISFLGIPPLTFLFIPLMLITMGVHSYKVSRRRRKLAGKPEKVNDAFIGSWF